MSYDFENFRKMKKIILSAALLGSVYFSNAQVGIGTPTPNASAMLDVTAIDKGVLIPRVELTSLTLYAPVVGDETPSLLVYATGKKQDGTVLPVDSGFYYWVAATSNPVVPAHWERVINQADLDAAVGNVTNIQEDVTRIKALLDSAYGSNNLGISPTTGTFGGMVYTPAIVNGDNPTTPEVETNFNAPAKFEYVKWSTTSNTYEKIDITADLVSLIQGNETKTTIVTYNNKQYYLSEAYIQADGELDTNNWSTVPSGAILIDVVGGVANNFLELSTTTTNILKPGGGNYTVSEYIEMLANSNATGDTKIVVTGDGTSGAPYVATLQMWDGTTWIAVPNTAFSSIVKANESKTGFITGTKTTGEKIIFYVGEEYLFDNAFPTETNANGWANNSATIPATIKVLDIPASVSSNFETILDQTTTIEVPGQSNTFYTVEEYIKQIAMTIGGNVGYTTTQITVAQNTIGANAGLAIPANSFYYVDANGVKVLIPLNDIVHTGITNLTVTQVNDVKNILGDNFNTTTVVNTGDTWVDGKTIYKAVVDSSVLAGSANLSNRVLATQTQPEVPGFIEIPGTLATGASIISIKIIGSNGVSASATDLSVDGQKIYFRIGTGNMYTVLNASAATSIKVMVEFAGNYTPPPTP